MANSLADHELERMSDWVAGVLGLHFPASRWVDLERGLTYTAKELGFTDAATCARQFISSSLGKEQLETLAAHLTVGETYFFRDQRSFQLLGERIIPELIHAQPAGEKRLRIWSAACCTGEEAYSIAIVLRRAIPDLQNWNVTLLATDVNPRFLRKAAAGVFGRWSFRDVPDWLLPQYFRQVGEGQFEILPEIRRMVQFANLNLVEDVYPSLLNNTNAMDVIFCRNVLMYFTAGHAKRVVEKLSGSQADGGWLVVSPGEMLSLTGSAYVRVNLGDSIVYRKQNKLISEVSPQLPTARIPSAPPTMDRVLIRNAKPAQIDKDSAQTPAPEREFFESKTRALANQGKLYEAMDCCDRWIAQDKLDPIAHYLHATILQEQGRLVEAVRSLRATIYLDPRFVLAHVSLASIAKTQGDLRAANRHLSAAIEILRRYGEHDVVPQSDGMTAGRMTDIVRSLVTAEAS